MSAELSHREKLHCKKPTNLEDWKIQYQLLKTATNTHQSRKPRCSCHQVYYLIRLLKTLTIKSVLDFWKRIMSDIVRQVQQKRKIDCEIQINTQYSALATNMLWSCQNILDEKWPARPIPITLLAPLSCTLRTLHEGLELRVEQAQYFFRRKTDKFKSIVARRKLH